MVEREIKVSQTCFMPSCAFEAVGAADEEATISLCVLPADSYEQCDRKSHVSGCRDAVFFC